MTIKQKAKKKSGKYQEKEKRSSKKNVTQVEFKDKNIKQNEKNYVNKGTIYEEDKIVMNLHTSQNKG